MIVIGLTGGIGSGKSTVSRKLKDLGATVIDADQVARDVVKPGTPALREIVQAFGSGILNDDGTLNRKKLGALVFQDPAARAVLNQITHPWIKEAIFGEVEKYRRQPDSNQIVVVEAALLIEVDLHHGLDQIWVVQVDERVQLERLMNRDGITAAEARQRIASQLPQAEKLKFATRVIDNSGSEAETKKQVERHWARLPINMINRDLA
jgi:dephospho-CoA kinase